MSQTTRKSPRQKAIDYFDRMGRLNLWSGVLAHRYAEQSGREHLANREAEAAYVRKNVWGWDGDSGWRGGTEGEEMHDTILGDVTHPTPIIVPQAQSSVGPLLAGLALGMLPMAGIGGAGLTYLLTREPPAPQVQTFDDGSAEIRLGRWENYQRQFSEPKP